VQRLKIAKTKLLSDVRYTVSGEKSIQLPLPNFYKFRHSFVIFDTNHPDSLFGWKKTENLFQILSYQYAVL